MFIFTQLAARRLHRDCRTCLWLDTLCVLFLGMFFGDEDGKAMRGAVMDEHKAGEVIFYFF